MGIETNKAALHTEPVASPTQSSSSGDSIHDVHDNEKDRDPEKTGKATLSKIQSNATGISEVSQTTHATEPPKRSLWQRINPLKRNPPPVPEIRGQSREYTAGFFSLMTFQWITPLMRVCGITRIPVTG